MEILILRLLKFLAVAVKTLWPTLAAVLAARVAASRSRSGTGADTGSDRTVLVERTCGLLREEFGGSAWLAVETTSDGRVLIRLRAPGAKADLVRRAIRCLIAVRNELAAAGVIVVLTTPDR